MLEELRALELLLEQGRIETGVQRIGVEQEMFLVKPSGRPAPVAVELLEQIDDPRFTTELARFNIEANLPAVEVHPHFLHNLETDLNQAVQRAAQAALPLNAQVLLTGILPSLQREDLTLDNMTPLERYRQLNDSLLRLRGREFSIVISGLDDLNISHTNVMLEAANTSLQLHLQVDPDQFAPLYNLAQLISAPLVAVAANSPLLLGRRLWNETRVALFEHSVDSRSGSERERGILPRVSFGSGWLQGSVIELFREVATRYRVVLTRNAEADPVGVVTSGGVPELRALGLHNGTVWLWNRACYGVCDGRAHLRIENRVLPSGPSVVDEVANAAFYYGLMFGMAKQAPEIPKQLDFDDAKGNFLAAARHALGASFVWLGAREVGARELILDELLPIAERGLQEKGISEEDIARYLGIIKARVTQGRTGAKWALESATSLREGRTLPAVFSAVTASMWEAQQSGQPVHEWSLATDPSDSRPHHGCNVGDIMTTHLFTVRPEDVIDLATSVMDWQHIRHVPVETESGEVVGLVSHRSLLKIALRPHSNPTEPVSIESIMDRDHVIVGSSLPLVDALELVLTTKSGCLLVQVEGRLTGIVTEHDLLRASAKLLRHTPTQC